MPGYEEFKRFENFEIMGDESIDLATNYVCLNITMICTPTLQNVKLFYKNIQQQNWVKLFAMGN